MNERIYKTVDKSDWGPGPWQHEPDKVSWTDETTGYPCLARRHPRLGHWCGYVGVPSGHPAYEKDYDSDVLEDVYVHGGFTYADHCEEGPEAESVCHIPEPGQPDDVWWLGFDCAHWQDLSPGMRALIGDYPLPDETYKTLQYVRVECAGTASQLAALS